MTASPPTTSKEEKSMDADRFDAMARALIMTRSRRSLARLLGGGVLAGAVVHGLVPEVAAIRRSRKRCRRKGGVYLEQGQCHCAPGCDTSDFEKFPCQNTPGCVCMKSAAGKGFCAAVVQKPFPCSTDADCEPGATCVVTPGCPDTGGSCTTSADCADPLGCVKGRCQATTCTRPCTT